MLRKDRVAQTASNAELTKFDLNAGDPPRNVNPFVAIKFIIKNKGYCDLYVCVCACVRCFAASVIVLLEGVPHRVYMTVRRVLRYHHQLHFDMPSLCKVKIQRQRRLFHIFFSLFLSCFGNFEKNPLIFNWSRTRVSWEKWLWESSVGSVRDGLYYPRIIFVYFIYL